MYVGFWQKKRPFAFVVQSPSEFIIFIIIYL